MISGIRMALVGLSLSALLIASISYAWPGEVLHVADGDTITVQKGQERVNIRLYGIDTPESPDGHFKMPHLWPGQNVPPRRRISVY